jgi:hypothetical protein
MVCELRQMSEGLDRGNKGHPSGARTEPSGSTTELGKRMVPGVLSRKNGIIVEGRLRVLLKLRKEIEAIQGPLPDDEDIRPPDEDNDDEDEIPQNCQRTCPSLSTSKIFNTPSNLQGQIRPL